MKQRESNFELMRIISMYMIVIWHIFIYGANMNATTGPINFIYDFFRSFMVVHVNSFVLLCGYFQCKSEFKLKKVVSLNNAAWFYRIIIFLIFIFFNFANLSSVAFLRNFFPLDLENYWFIKIYLVLYLISPFLNIFINNLNKFNYRKLLILGLIMFSIIPTITNQEAIYNTTNYGYSLVSFMYLYLVGAYLRIYPFEDTSFSKKCTKTQKKMLFLVSFILLAMFNFSLHIVSKDMVGKGSMFNYFANIINICFNQYDNPIVIIQSICYLQLFYYISIKSKFINKVASTTMGIYLIHENLFLRHNMYKILKFNEPILEYTWAIFIRIFIYGLIIFVVCSIIEKIRQIVFLFISNRKISIKFSNKCNNFFENIKIKQ